MVFRYRSFLIWIIGLVIVSAAYVIVTRISDIPQIEYTQPSGIPGGVDSNSQIGMVGPTTGVGTVERAVFKELDENKQVVGEFGFKELLYKRGSQWEIERPYRNLYQSTFDCYITADRGNVLLETDVDRPEPKDAEFVGNVVIHILPKRNSNFRQCYLYLDDITFISEKSMFTTYGPVRFVSEDISLLGEGLKVIYNETESRIEYLEIIELKKLRIRNSNVQGISRSSKGKEDSVKPAVAKQPSPQQQQADSVETTEKADGYKCVLRENVIIDAPQQVVFASDEIFINNIIAGNSSKNSEQPASTGQAVEKRENIPVDSNSADERETVSESGCDFVEDANDIVVTCDGGIVAMPINSDLMDVNLPRSKTTIGGEEGTVKIPDAAGRAEFVTESIEYDATSGQTVASGMSELTFYVRDIAGSSDVNKPLVPVKVYSGQKVIFMPDDNRVVFDGDCLGKMVCVEPGYRQRYILSADRFIVDLQKRGSSGTDMKHFTADGGIVRLTTTKIDTSEKMFEGVELKCRRFDFDPNGQLATATGPGVIKMDNSHLEVADDTNKSKFSFDKPCWAMVENFDELKFFIGQNQLIADAANRRINIGYYSILDERTVMATAGRIVADFVEGGGGRNELSSFVATEGVSYEEKNAVAAGRKKKKDVDFMGSGFFYDADANMITAWGNELWPCSLNGVGVDGVEYNLETGKAKTKLVSPSMLH